MTYPLELVNRTGAADSFDLTFSTAHGWPATLSIPNTGVIPEGGVISFTAEVNIPTSASACARDMVTVQASSTSSPTVLDTALLNTIVSGVCKVYLPALSKPQIGLQGRVTLNGAPAAGVALDLRFYNGSSWSTAASTTSGADGSYTWSIAI